MSAADFSSVLLAPAGPHPAPDALRQYAAGHLPPAEQQRIEAHALDCERCADVLAGLTLTDATTTDRALAQLRTRLHARVAPEPAAAYQPSRWPRLAAAAALLGGLLVGGIGGWELREATFEPATTAPTEAPAPAVASAPPPASKPETSAIAPAPEAAETTLPQPAPKPDNEAVAAAAPVARRQPRRAATTAAPDAKATAPTQTTAADVAFQAAPPQAKTSEAAMSELSGTASTPTLSPEEEALRAKARARAAAIAATEPAAPRAAPMPATPSIVPAPADGLLALREYIRRSAAEFEPDINARHLSGTVHLRFIVGADGKLSDIKVVRGIRDDYDAEAKRIIIEGPAWTPGVAGGRRAPLPVELKVSF